MCGIVGYVGAEQAWPVVVSGLRRLAYRGYDSAGIAVVHRRRIRMARRTGRLEVLESAFPEGLAGHLGIGHTRWATHGKVTEANCHPHTDPEGTIAVVHNGIIDNADALRAELIDAGATFSSETDTEVLAHLICGHHDGGRVPLLDAVRKALRQISGSAGILVVSRHCPEIFVAARLGSPVIIGLGDGCAWAASDQAALAPLTDRVVILDDGELAEVSAGGFRTVDLENRARASRIQAIESRAESAELGDWPHHMLKEIFEQPAVLERAMRGRLDESMGSSRLAGLDELGRQIFDLERAVLFGCGTSLHSAQVGQGLLERWAQMPCRAEDAPEWMARNPLVTKDALYVALSQSGETADTLDALREIKVRGGVTAGLTNVVGSTIARETDSGVHLHAGPEISVCSTKAFSAQIIVLAMVALRLGRMRHLSASKGRAWIRAMQALPEQVQTMLDQKDTLRALAEKWSTAPYIMFVGRGLSAAVAREGALKLKEVAYIPCDGLSAASMKHGPLALITPGTPVWAIAPPDDTLERTLANLQELKARGAHLMVIAKPGHPTIDALADVLIPLPDHLAPLSPLLTVVPLQLFAYYAAVARDCEVDTPRNLAKSITVT